MVVVYFRLKKDAAALGCIIGERWRKDMNKCYLCPVKNCRGYSDGLFRVECSADVAEAIRKNRNSEIIKILEVQKNGN